MGFSIGLDDTISRDNTRAPRVNISFGGFKILDLATPTGSTDAATKGYADGLLVNTPLTGNTTIASVAIGGGTPTVAAVGGACQVNGELISKGPLAGLFAENRDGGVTGSTNWYGFYPTGSSFFLYNGGANIGSFNVSSGAYSALSDARKKDLIEHSNIGIDHVMRVTPWFYTLKTDPEGAPRKLGFTVQDIEAAGIAEAVVRIDVTDDEMTIEDEWLGLDPMPLIATLWLAVRQQEVRIRTLEGR